MENIQRTRDLPCRKQITFDLNDKRLQVLYPCQNTGSQATYYKKAWKDIARFMAANNFEHSQYSVYESRTDMTKMDVDALVTRMVARMPWLSECLNAISVTDIGEQYDLMSAVSDARAALERHHTPHNNA